jgi:hypothetical protein
VLVLPGGGEIRVIRKKYMSEIEQIDDYEWPRKNFKV